MRAFIPTLMAVLSLLTGSSCTTPALIHQPVVDEPSLLVGLARQPDTVPPATGSSQRSVELSERDLHAILKRLFIRKGTGLMDASSPLHPVFSPEDVAHLSPHLHKAMSLAGTEEWVVFALWGSSNPLQTLEVTSGGLYQNDQSLHIVLANHRERVSSEEQGITAIRDNPFHSLKDRQGTMLFHPANFMIRSGTRWMGGGFASPASELVLDYPALLVTETPSASPHEERDPASHESPSSSSPEMEAELLRKEISDLQSELSRIKEQLAPRSEATPESPPAQGK